MENLTDAVKKAAKEEEKYLVEVKNSLTDIQTGSETALEDIINAHKNTENLRMEITRMGAMSLAMEQINRLELQKQMEFSVHKKVREMTLGVVRDLNPGTVRNGTIRELAEELYINCPEYWLSHALLAVAAWIRNERAICDGALRNALRIDPGKSSLFFCLMNLRVNRNEAASSWLTYYFQCQNPQTMQPESGILLQAYLGGLFGKTPELQEKVESVILEWEDQIARDHKMEQNMTEAYSSYLLFLPEPPREPLPTLREYSSDYEFIDKSRGKFGKCGQMAQIVALLREAEPDDDVEAQRRMSDRVLDRLLSEMVPEELEIERQIQSYELIRKHRGDREKAGAELYYSKQQNNDDMTSIPSSPEGGRPFGIGIRMVRWALDDNGTTSPNVRRYALHHTSRWLLEAAGNIMEQNERNISAGLPRIHIRIGGWKGETDGQDYEQHSDDLQAWFARRKRQIQFFNVPNMTALILLVLSLILTMTTPYALAGAAVCVLFLVYRILNGLRGFDRLVERSLQTLENAVAEAAVFYEEAEADRKEYRILEEELAEL